MTVPDRATTAPFPYDGLSSSAMGRRSRKYMVLNLPSALLVAKQVLGRRFSAKIGGGDFDSTFSVVNAEHQRFVDENPEPFYLEESPDRSRVTVTVSCAALAAERSSP